MHDNILVYGKDYIRIITETSQHSWIDIMVGRKFHSIGVTVDSKKIQNIKDGGRPENNEDVRSLLMAYQYNAKFSFKLHTTYEDTTAPLCKLLKKEEIPLAGRRGDCISDTDAYPG